jgi:NADPH:quinone reductase-like Zn-dependent oxidoreductase
VRKEEAKIMRAAVVKKFGGPEAVEVLEVPLPEPGPLEVRIKVAAAALNPADTVVRAGVFRPLEEVEYTGLGFDAAGTLDAVGPGVSLKVGTPVIAFDAPLLRPTKAQAEYLVTDLNSIAPAPEGMDLTLAATIPLNATTASLALDYLRLRPRDTLLVTGAAGAVGGYAVELARTRGVRIVAQGRPEDEEFLRGRASWFVSSDEELSEAVRRFVLGGVDGVLDAAALDAPALAAVRDGGIFVSVRGDVLPAAERGVVVRLTTAGPEATRLSYLSALAEVGVLTPRVAQIYPLSQAAEAHAQLARGSQRGRIVLVP